MPVIRLETDIRAPADLVFDLSLSIDVHREGMVRHGESALSHLEGGQLAEGDEVTWKAKHFGLWWKLTSRITRFERPAYFRDSQVKGPFARFDHDHYFEERGGGTRMLDVFDFNSPLGLIGSVVDRLLLRRYMVRLLRERNRVLKEAAEREGGVVQTL